MAKGFYEIVGGTIQFKIFFTLLNVLLLLKRVSIIGQKSFKGSGRFSILVNQKVWQK